ncbi:MAG: hypothetical protein HC852_02160 [Acaryochloridaceae cyanobacterium RU_4_10]|nr:hypothetical protein [Acaryochloridaceae cyanobacterium RU_4_10]
MNTNEASSLPEKMHQIDVKEHNSIHSRGDKGSTCSRAKVPNVSSLFNSMFQKKSFRKLGWMTAAISTAATSLLFFGISPSIAGNAPSCLRVSPSGNSVRVTNTCGSYKRYKVIVAFGPDSSCRGINNREVQVVRWSFGRFDGLDSC